MSAKDLKKELVAYIENTDDEELLSFLKEDLVFYGSVKGVDITDGLSEDQMNQLKTLSEENEMKDTHTLEEYTKMTEKWRIK